MRALKQPSTILGLVGGLLVVSSVGNSQQTEGLVLRFDVGTQMRADDNYGLEFTSPGTAAFLTQSLGFEVLSQTQAQTLRFGADADFRVGNIPGASQSTGLDNEHIFLDYSRENASNKMSFGARYNSSDVSSSFLLSDPNTPLSQDLIIDRGTVQTYGSNVLLDLGTDAVFGVTLQGRHNKREYQRTTNTGLFDTETNSFSATGNLRFSSTLTGTIKASWDTYSAQDSVSTDREITRFGFGLKGDITPTLSFNTSISQDTITTDTITGGVAGTVRQNGWSGKFGLVRALNNGTITADLSNSFSVNGGQTSLVFGRDFELARGGLSVTFGMTKSDNGNTRPIGSLSYSQNTATSTFSAQLSRSYQTDIDGDLVERTQAALGYDYQINSVAALNMSLDYTHAKDSTNGTDTKRGNLRVSYDRDVTKDWVLSGGIEARYADSTANARSNAVFLSLNRSFQYKR